MEELKRLLKLAKYTDYDKSRFLMSIKNRFEDEKLIQPLISLKRKKKKSRNLELV